MAIVELVDPLQHVGLDAGPQTEIAALLPAVHGIALRLEEARKGWVEKSLASRPGNTSTGCPSPRGAAASHGRSSMKAPSS